MEEKNKTLKIERFMTPKGLNITCIKSDKFKTNIINLFIHNQLDSEFVTQNALLPMVLKRGSRDYPTMQELSKKLENLYGSLFDCGVIKKGERQIMHFYMDGINDKYLQTEGKLFNECVTVLNSIISNPLIENERFKDQYIKQEKENLKKLIKSRINEKTRYAIERCFELMCSDERYGVHELGKLEDIDDIDGFSLADRYKKIINTAKVDLMVLGDIDDRQLKVLDEMLSLKTDNSNNIDKENPYKGVQKVRTFIEEMVVNQGKLSMGFRTNVSPHDSDYYPLVVCNSILGGGVHSKLFQNVREKASLAYYVFSRLEKFKGIMMISSGIEAKNYEKTKEIILKQIEEIQKGNISDFEFDCSIKTFENRMKAIADEPLQMIDFFLGQSILETNDDFKAVINNIKNVKLEDVVKVSQKIKLDTIHFLKPKA